MITYPLHFVPDDNGTILVTCPALPEVTTFGETEEEAFTRGNEAIEEAIGARMAGWEEIPAPTLDDIMAAPDTDSLAHLPLLTRMKLELYLACREAGISRADLVRRLGWHREQVDRLFRLDHSSRVDQLEEAMNSVGQVLEVSALKRA